MEILNIEFFALRMISRIETTASCMSLFDVVVRLDEPCTPNLNLSIL